MFPKNWSFKRIQEEVAWVYENTVAKGGGLDPNSINKKFKRHKFFDSSNSFEIIIEIDKLNKVVNSFPLIQK